MASLWLQRACLLMALSVLVAAEEPQTLCAGELVDAIQFVCGLHRYSRTTPGLTRTDKNRLWNNLIETCCYKQCSMEVLEQFCQTMYRRN
ncbi:hypothetical protein WMY93_008133 [Mugilogobius chulae]|uniref:Insulin-like domain-containing protein n=1 Tax=Mugilogobius chulae TaxID=88201 RepID=A0AAW0PID4_9GOBI